MSSLMSGRIHWIATILLHQIGYRIMALVQLNFSWPKVSKCIIAWHFFPVVSVLRVLWWFPKWYFTWAQRPVVQLQAAHDTHIPLLRIPLTTSMKPTDQHCTDLPQWALQCTAWGANLWWSQSYHFPGSQAESSRNSIFLSTSELHFVNS